MLMGDTQSKLIYIGDRTQTRPPFFPPDRIENLIHDAADDESMTVYDAAGVAIWGRVVSGSGKRWECRMHDWLWVPGANGSASLEWRARQFDD